MFNLGSLDFNLVMLPVIRAHHSIYIIGLVVDLLLHRQDVVACIISLVGFVDSGPILFNLFSMILLNSNVGVKWSRGDYGW
jgi:hypothetical protein